MIWFELLRRQTAGTVTFRLDRTRMFLGVSVEGQSIVLACFGLVAEYVRPESVSFPAIEIRRRRTIRAWQKIRNGLWVRAELVLKYDPDETAEEFDARRLNYVTHYYQLRAADARALHPERWVPDLAELAVAPMPGPTSVH